MDTKNKETEEAFEMTSKEALRVMQNVLTGYNSYFRKYINFSVEKI